MLRAYENDEIPKGYRDCLKSNGTNINEIKYIVIPDDEFKSANEFLKRIMTERDFKVLTTIMDISFYAFYKKENE